MAKAKGFSLITVNVVNNYFNYGNNNNIDPPVVPTAPPLYSDIVKEI